MRLAVIASAVLVTTLSVTPIGARQAPTVMDGLQAYVARDVAKALAPVRSLEDLKAVRQALQQDAPKWIGSVDGADRRALVAAAFALEVASKTLASDDAEKETAVARAELLEWGARTLPTSPAMSPSVRDWFAAAIAFVETKDWNGLTPLRSTVVRAWGLPLLSTTPLIMLALDRYPEDPQFLRSQAIVEARFGWPIPVAPGQPFRDSPPDLPDLSVDTGSVYSMGSLFGSARDLQALLTSARARFEKLTTVPEVAGEAHLRAGYTQLVVAERSGARKHFREAERLAKDADAQYLCRLFTAWSWDHDKHPVEAEASYRSALVAVPGARGASTLLAALLAGTDRRGEAAQLMDAALRTSTPVADPMKAFMQGDGRHWPAALTTLRGHLQ